MTEFPHGRFQVGNGEVWPALRQEDKFGESALPEQKIGEALFAAGADEQVDLG